MIRTQPIIGVADVAKSSEWYQSLLDCKSNHGGDVFEILADQDDTVILCLHRWGEHDHPTILSPEVQPGNGLILYLCVDELDKVWENAKRIHANIEEPPHINENSGKKQFCLRDPDGYYLMISL